MAYRNKIYVCFDADNDMKYYQTMQMWAENEDIEFDFYDAHDRVNLRKTSSEDTIKLRLRERIADARVFVVLLDEKTKTPDKYTRWEIEIALDYYKIPIICVNLNEARGYDRERCPEVLQNKLALHISYQQHMMVHAIKNWSSSHVALTRQMIQKPRRYKDSVYESLGL